MPTLRSRLSRVAVPLAALRLIGQGGEFLAFIILARRLGTSGFGEISVAYLICRYGGLLADWGASLKGTRDVAAGRHPNGLHDLVRRRTLTTVILTTAFVLGAIWSGHVATAPLALTIVGRGLGRDWLALGEERGIRAGIPSAAQGAAAVILCLLASSVSTAAWALGAAYAIAAFISVRLNPLPSRADEVVGERGGVDPWFLILLVADQVYASADVILISILLSTSDAGIYAAVYRFPNALVTILGLTVMGLLPGLTRVVTTGSRQFADLRRRALRIGAIAAGIVVITIPLAWIAVPIAFGSAYDPGQGPLVLLLLATAFPAFTVGLQPLYFAARREQPLALFAVGVAVLNVVINLLVIPSYGLMGAATVTLISQALVAAFYVLGTRPAMRE